MTGPPSRVRSLVSWISQRLGAHATLLLQQSGQPHAQVRTELLHGADQVEQELAQLVVALVERKPGGRAALLLQPGRQQHGFACPCRGRNEHQLGPNAPFEQRHKLGPRDDVNGRNGRVKLGAEQGQGHC